ncbi:hypothetical protein HZ326_19471 [Fusarium oxysporum f. sp. albedinis]|nr:hypothetical protein HZ326_19471 [Fusarium oxysporum f. sp. albedinis]
MQSIVFIFSRHLYLYLTLRALCPVLPQTPHRCFLPFDSISRPETVMALLSFAAAGPTLEELNVAIDLLMESSSSPREYVTPVQLRPIKQ